MTVVVGLDRVTDLLQEGLRKQARWGSLPTAALLGSALELFSRRQNSKLALALARTQLALGVLVHWILPSRPAAKLVERGLSRQGERTQAGLAGLMGVVRATGPLHQGSWELNLAATSLHSLTLDGTGSRLFERASFVGAELDDVRLLGLLAGADFARTKTRRCSFLGCALWRSSFRRARIEDAVVVASDASGCDFKGAELVRCTLTDVTLSGTSFDGASLREVVFERCDLSGVLVGDSTWENVDLVDCENVGEDLAALSQTRTTLGATPRSLYSDVAPGDARGRVIVRYAGTSTQSRPPLGYRVETLARLLSIWVALGSNYREARRRWRSSEAPLGSDIFPPNRLLFALKILAGRYRLSDQDHPAAVVYALLANAFEKRCPDLDGTPLPELIFVDGNRPVVKYVDMGGLAYIVMSMGMEVMATRLARYCVAWKRPEAIGYMDRPPAGMEPEAVRDALRRDLEWFARSGDGDITGVGRVQLTGLRHTQATLLTMTFLAFTLAHEIAHFLHARGLADLRGGTWGEELEADILAAEVIRGEGELDGDAVLVEAVQEADAQEVRRVLRLMQSEGDDDALDQLNIDSMSDDELKELAEGMAPHVTRFAESNWHAAAVAALTLIVGGSVGYEGEDDLERRLATIIGAVFGKDVLVSLQQEMATEGSVLHLLRDVFIAPGQRS